MDTDNHHHGDQPEFEEAQGLNFSPNGLKQTFDKNENDEILILEEKLYFGPGSEQVKIPLDILGIDEIDAIGSFSITMNVKVSTNLNNIKNDQIFFQIGSSVMNKTLVLGITRDRTFFASCLTQKNKLETCYTQCKVKNQEYHIGVSVIDEGTFSELTIFVNGQSEASLVFPSSIDPLQGYFVYGSDSPVDGFVGEVSEAMFYVKIMEPHDMKECFASRRTSPGDKSIYQIRKEKKDFLNATDYYSKKKGLPVNLVRTHGVEKTKKEGENEEQKRPENPNSEEAKKQRQIQAMIEELKDLIYQDETLYLHARDLGFNFEWVFKVCSVLSPVIEDKGSQPKHSFGCLHNSLCEGEARYYPCYAITVDQFMKVVSKLDTKLNSDEVIKMAERIDCFDVNKEFGNFIYYDKFLLAVRNAVFSKQEIKYINKARNDEVEKQVIKTERVETEAPGQPQTTSVVTAYNLIPIFENADYFDQKDFIEANPDAVLVKIILSIYKPTNHIRFIHFAYKLKSGKIHEFEVGKPITSGLENMVHFTIDINDDEFLTGVKASNYHANNANKLISYLSFSLNTHPEGIAYGQFTGHPGELKAINFDPSEYKDKKILGFYGAFRDELIGLGVYVKEKVVVKPAPVTSPEEAKKAEAAGTGSGADTDDDGEEYVLTLPQVKQEWNEGRIQVIMNRCSDCNKHKTTTSHHEADFCMKFNEWGNRIKDYFPNAEIIGNYDKPKVFGIFEIYIRGVGPNHDRDNEGRIFLHQNYTTPEMKTNFAKVFEILVMYCFEYGDSVEMAKAQGTFLKKHAHEIPKKWTGCHDHPVDVPERVSQTQSSKRGGKGKIEDGTQVVCQHWGCGQRYSYDSMNESACTHHPGRYEFGSVHGLWPEGWTCCRGNWEDRGCKKGKHAPIPANRFYQLCINHGDLNPKTGKPDSACGRSYQDSSDECKYHQGYLIGRGLNSKWTCCGEAGETAPPCVSGSHKSAEWPDEEAKLYFVTRDIRNPGIYRDNSGAPSFAAKVTNSGYYRKTKPYTIYENPQRKRAKEREESENETRVCMNWGCGHTYKDVDNKKVKHCRSHPGVWDFGYTGITVSQAISEFNRDNSDVLLWKPHWTCCRQPWIAKGCTKTYHRGPLQTEAVEPKYKWPSEDAQKFFRKTVSPLWKAKLENQYMLEPIQVAQKFDDFAKTMGGKINMGMLPQFCDKLRLHLLIVSEDLSNHIRFLQVVNHTADAVLDDGQGNIDKKKFLEWWYAKLDE